MADRIALATSPSAPTAKIRNPVAVPILTIITLGIYGIYWWYQINREMVDLGRVRNATGVGDKPFVSFLAVFPGALLVVPPYVSLYNTVMRIQRTQEVAAGSITLNGMVVLWLILASFLVGVTAFVVPGYIQAELNKAWSAVGAQGDPAMQIQSPRAAMASETTTAPPNPSAPQSPPGAGA